MVQEALLGMDDFHRTNGPLRVCIYALSISETHFTLEKVEERPTLPTKLETASEVLYRKTSDGQFVPVTQGVQSVVASPVKLEVPIIEKETPKKQPAILATIPTGTTASVSQTDPRIKDWNGWPDGQFSLDLTFDEFKATGNLKVHWAHKVHGGDRTGDSHAPVYEKGKRSSRKCLGVLACDNPDCEVIVRPNVRPEKIEKQLLSGCPKCRSSLTRVTCENVRNYGSMHTVFTTKMVKDTLTDDYHMSLVFFQKNRSASSLLFELTQIQALYN